MKYLVPVLLILIMISFSYGVIRWVWEEEYKIIGKRIE